MSGTTQQRALPTSVDADDVRDELAAMRGEGRRYVKARDVARRLGLSQHTSSHSAVGTHLAACDAAVKWSDPVSGAVTWRIVPDSPREVRDS